MSGKKTAGILLVEDEGIVALDARVRLESLGYRITGIADNADDALALAVRVRPDLVLMDIRIKGASDGIEAAERLRGVMDVPVVFATAYADDETLTRAAASGPYGYIVKPYQERELRIVIELALAKHRYQLELEAARDAAEAASRAKTRFLSIMSHELMTPLSSIVGFSELALEEASAEQRENLEVVLSSARSLRKLIASVLEYARLESGDARLAPEPVDLPALLGAVLAEQAPRIWEKDLDISLSIDRELAARIRLDGRKLRYAVSSLVDNAVKFTSRGFVRLAASRAALADGRSALRLEVSDSGPGIPEDRRAEAFEDFVQLDATSSRRAGGTGLGLAAVRGLAGLMGGQVELLERPGGGTIARLDLPCPEAGEKAEAPIPVYKGLRLMILGLAEPCASDLASAAEALGASVESAPGLPDALDLLARDKEGRLVLDERAWAGAQAPEAALLKRILTLGRRGGSRREEPAGSPFCWYPAGVHDLAEFMAGASRARPDSELAATREDGASSPSSSEGDFRFMLSVLHSGLADRREDLEDLARLAAEIAKALPAGDLDATERSAALYRERCMARGSELGSRAAFAALRAARRRSEAELSAFALIFGRAAP